MSPERQRILAHRERKKNIAAKRPAPPKREPWGADERRKYGRYGRPLDAGVFSGGLELSAIAALFGGGRR